MPQCRQRNPVRHSCLTLLIFFRQVHEQARVGAHVVTVFWVQARWGQVQRPAPFRKAIVEPRALGRQCVCIVENIVIVIKAAQNEHPGVQQCAAVEAKVGALLQHHNVEIYKLVLPQQEKSVLEGECVPRVATVTPHRLRAAHR